MLSVFCVVRVVSNKRIDNYESVAVVKIDW